MAAHDYRCISRKIAEHCDCRTWKILDAATCLPGPVGHCGCFFHANGAPIPGTCCTCGAVNEFVPAGLKDALAFGASDWSVSRDTAWVYGIVMGWGCEEDHDHDWICGADEAYQDCAERFGWDDATIARLRRLHDAFNALAAGGSPEGQLK